MEPLKSDLHIDLDPNASETSFGRKIIERAQQRIDDESLARQKPKTAESRAYRNLIGSPEKTAHDRITEAKASRIIKKAYQEVQAQKRADEAAEKHPKAEKEKEDVKKAGKDDIATKEKDVEKEEVIEKDGTEKEGIAKEDIEKEDVVKRAVTKFKKPLSERMKKGITVLKEKGFKDVPKEEIHGEKEAEEEDMEHADENPSAKEVFKTTYDKYPGALIDGGNLPYSMEEEHEEPEKEQEEQKSFYQLKKTYQKKSDETEEEIGEKKSKKLERPKSSVFSRIFKSPFKAKSREQSGESKKLEKKESVIISPPVADREEPELLPDLPPRVSVEDLRDSNLEPGETIEVGDVGFIEVILETNFPDLKEHLKDRLSRRSREKEIKKQKEVKRLDINLKAYFEDPDKVLGPEIDMTTHIKNLISKSRLDKEPGGILEDLKADQLEATYSPTKKSGWSPGSLENLLQKKEKERTPSFIVKTRSWLGTYIIGTDYWKKKEEGDDVLLHEKIGFDMDEERPWYDLALSLFASVGKKSKDAEDIAIMSRDMMKNLKINIPDCKVGTVTSSGTDRLDSTTFLHPDWNEELLSLFHRFSRLDEATTVKSKLSLTSIDRWLESVGILDFTNVTLINTGLCYKLAGGHRYGGLNYPEFKYFLDLMARSVNKPFSSIVSQMFAAYGDQDLSPENLTNS